MPDPRTEFFNAVFWHGSPLKGDLILAEHSDLDMADIHIAAMIGNEQTVRRYLAADPSIVHAKSGPRNVDPLTALCFSAYLRDESLTDAFVRTATALLDAGADVNAGFYDESHTPPEWESLLYGAAGLAFNAPVTKLLLDRGADPNDNETPYHSPETDDNRALQVLLDSGKLNADSMNMMLLRKTDWHDLDGLRRILDAGADPNRMTRWGKTALHNAILSNNSLAIIELLLDRGADPTIVAPTAQRGNAPTLANKTAIELAARRGRADALRSFGRRGFSLELPGVERALMTLALDGRPEETWHREVLADGATYLAEFTVSDNVRGMARLIELGVPVDARYKGDGYFGIAPGSTPLHVASWMAWQDAIDFLIAHGADVNAADARGRTPLQLAVMACVNSYWAYRRTPNGVRSLLAAGARKDGITLPTGYADIDALLA